jgi:hypothetical protein
MVPFQIHAEPRLVLPENWKSASTRVDRTLFRNKDESSQADRAKVINMIRFEKRKRCIKGQTRTVPV